MKTDNLHPLFADIINNHSKVMETKTETFDSAQAHLVHAKWCNDNQWPHFAPTRFCYSCRKDIYAQIDHGNYKTGISVERADGPITGCPHCCHSFCD